jgi:hypothetical protein
LGLARERLAGLRGDLAALACFAEVAPRLIHAEPATIAAMSLRTSSRASSFPPERRSN